MSDDSPMIGSRVKRTCDNCSRSKVKCSGDVPCLRCARACIPCDYSIEKKRGRKRKGSPDSPEDEMDINGGSPPLGKDGGTTIHPAIPAMSPPRRVLNDDVAGTAAAVLETAPPRHLQRKNLESNFPSPPPPTFAVSVRDESQSPRNPQAQTRTQHDESFQGGEPSEVLAQGLKARNEVPPSAPLSTPQTGVVVGGTMVGNAKLKRTCEQCSKSKVSCCGKRPCTRCIQRKTLCEYVYERKRGRKAKLDSIKPVIMKDCQVRKYAEILAWGQVMMKPFKKPQDIGEILGLISVERRVFQLFFMLYKHHAATTSCCNAWFNIHINKLCAILAENKKHSDALERLQSWMRNKGIVAKTELELSEMYKVALDTQSHSCTLFEMIPKQERDELILSEIEMMKRNCYVRVRVQESDHSSNSKVINVETNEEFEKVFQYSKDDIGALLFRLKGGVLPWGTDFLTLLLKKESDVICFLRTVSLKFNEWGIPDKFPELRTVLSSHNLVLKSKLGKEHHSIVTAVQLILVKEDSDSPFATEVHFGIQTAESTPSRNNHEAHPESNGLNNNDTPAEPWLHQEVLGGDFFKQLLDWAEAHETANSNQEDIHF